MTSLVEEPSMTRTSAATLLELRGLAVEYGVGAKAARAVDGVDLAIHEGEILGLAGESGCGKSDDRERGDAAPAPARAHRRRQHPLPGRGSVGKSREELRRFRWRNVSIVLQSAMNALNPVMRVGDQFVDAMRAHERIDRSGARSRARASCSSSSASTAGARARTRTSSRAACGSA